MIQLPTYTQIVNRIRADVAANLPGTDPTIYGSYLRALADSLAGRAYDLSLLIRQLENELFPQTSSGEFLERWAEYEGLSRNSATPASGLVTIMGLAGTVIDIGTQFRASSSQIYSVLTGRTLAIQSQDVFILGLTGSTVTATTPANHNLATGVTVTIADAKRTVGLTCAGTTATATTYSDHYLVSGADVTISGAAVTEYNGTFTITVTGATTFTYTVSTPDLAPSSGYLDVPGYDGEHVVSVDSPVSFTYEITGTPLMSVVSASLNWAGHYTDVESVNTGSAFNLESGAQLLPVSPIGGAEVTATVQLGGVDGGSDTETDDALRIRTLQSRSNPVANFNPASLEKLVLSVPGVTRVKVKRIYSAVIRAESVGDVTILFLRDNDANPIPSGTEIQQVKDVVYPIVPAQSSLDDVHVLGPEPVTQDFVFSAIDPDTPSMREAIRQNLIALFDDEVTFETTVTEDKYRSAIANTVDPENGNILTSFVLTAPTGDIVIDDLEIALLGDVQFDVIP